MDERKKIKPKLQVNDLVELVDLEKTFSEGDNTKWSYKLYKIKEIINHTKSTYRIDNLPERYNEALLKNTELSMKENDSVTKKLNIS